MKILNLGSLNYDRVYDVTHFAVAGETIRSRDYGEFLGGKGLNQSLALARAGADVYHAGAVGTDGDALVRCLTESGVDVSCLQKLNAASGHAIIQSCSGQNCIIVCGGTNQMVEKDYIEGVLAQFSEGDILLLQNEVSNVAYAMESAKARGMKIALNASPITPELLAYPLHLVDWFLINEIEGSLLADIRTEDHQQVLSALRRKYPNAAVVLTLGGEGVLYADANETARVGVCKVDVVDTTAAGDTFCGYFLAGISGGLTVSESLRRATCASGLAVSQKGAANSIPNAEQVSRFAASPAAVGL